MSTQEFTNQQEEGKVLLELIGPVATLTISRPAALNALTWTMYQQLESHLDYLVHNDTIRAVIMRGAGKAFAAGTDIAQFQGFTVAEGLRYERKMEAIFEKVEGFPKPVIAAIHGYAVGAGLFLSAACDLRYATPISRFGAPIARTMGNALSLKNYARLETAFGTMRVSEMLFTARLFTAEEALQYGFLTEIIDEERIFAHVNEIARQVSLHAPLTMWAAKEARRRLRASQPDIPFDDVLARIYTSQDFAEGIRAYVEKRKPKWQGR
ncbi:MAG: enoyl-CoA hydratase/isomerase family protein [Ktedonobacteraceae bacterium]|nr:enoyl-CoA hydratase/isomerase family protein [Ktedonobacteraceae bacterium]